VASGSCRRKPGQRPLTDEIAIEFRQRDEDMEDERAAGRGRQRQPYALLGKGDKRRRSSCHGGMDSNQAKRTPLPPLSG
jgi:hypothetical protein